MKTQFNNLVEIKEKYIEHFQSVDRKVIVCAGTGCVASGSLKVIEEFKNQLAINNINHLVELKIEEEIKEGVLISGSGCQGFCQMAPLVTIEPDQIMYVKVNAEDVKSIVEKTIIKKEIIPELLYVDPTNGKKCLGINEIPFYKRQTRYVIENCGKINPSDINEYISLNGYEAARKAFLDMSAKDVCNEISFSGLRGRGGGGFSTGRKWELALNEKAKKKFVICNGDEGDPGAFMDRSIMEGNPHAVIEGMMIAAKAIGADKGYIYCRAEYPLAVKRLKVAVKQAEKLGLLGENIFGSGWNFNIEIMEGAGAFVCGEETALMQSIQGERGMPNPKPPFPSQSGLFGYPTIINNVETLATVPLILNSGAKYFSEIGTKNSPGTKTFALTGHVANTGLIEVPFGTTLREIVFSIGGGVTNDDGTICLEGFKAVQIGGPSGGCLTEEHLDLPLDFDSLTSIGAMVGSGGLVVMNKKTCMIKMARFFMQFTQNESCGKCVLCREGTKQMLSILDDITSGNGTLESLDLLSELGNAVKKGSLCGLGKTAPNPVLSLMNYFHEEYISHVVHKRCTAKQCTDLLIPHIDEVLCKGCGVCIKKCPTNAITGNKKEVHVINESLCIKCMACVDACRLNAVLVGD
ncbi:MAG: NADH-quinone oxidoreductase subunit F [Chlorobiaceae bacterium]|nr:NADH-quinone oxidoreductase subunit F [Chlorobiaceae bacterium]MBA4310418.1 NADH-quinone oxidoreductase subunit F [Chlorobiaceae bacterium]